MPLFTPELEFTDDYPTIEPSLKLDFANARALDPRITFTRASVATYVGANGLIKTAGEDEARFDHDPTTGESLGLLIEESRTNFIESSETTFGGTATGDFFRGKEIHNKTVNINQVYFASDLTNYNISVGDKYTLSGFIRSGSQTGSINIRWIDGLNAPVSGVNNFTYTPTTDGEFVSFEFTFSQAVLGSINCTLSGSSGDDADFAIMQLEKGSFPTSYIPTSGASAARAEEQAYMTGESFSSWYNPTEGSVVTAFNPTLYVGPSDGGRAFRIDHQTISDNRIDYVVTANGGYQPYVSINGVAPSGFGGINGTPFVVGTDYKISVGFAANDYVAYKNGTQTLSSTTPASVPIADRLSLGLNLNGHRKSFYYYPKRLANAQLQTLTQ